MNFYEINLDLLGWNEFSSSQSLMKGHEEI